MFGENFNINLGLFLLALWEAFWKGVGLWKSAQKGSLIWFIAIFIVNSFGILPLIYLWRTKQLNTSLADLKNFVFSRFKKD